MEKQLHQHRIIDAERLLSVLQVHQGQVNTKNVQLWLRFSGWKIQGTDGVRGIVSTVEVGPLDSLWHYIDNNIITPSFCNLYAKAWGLMIRDYFSNTDMFSSGKPFNRKIVLAEDGRDYFDKTGLKKGLIEGFNSLGISVADLGLAPTPALAAYSLANNLTGLMLTASHNPSEYNGIKIFLNGKKLYPEGELGEYLLSWYLFSLASDEFADSEKNIFNTDFSVFINNENIEEADSNILDNLSNSIGEKALGCLKTSKIVLDTANGVYTRTALDFFSQNEIEIIPIACNPGEKLINANCGVGLLEHLDPVLVDVDTNPDIIKELFAVGRLSDKVKAYGIILDGDGDRGFLLEYNFKRDRVFLYNGDAIGYIIASGLIRSGSFDMNPNLQFVSTVESDAALAIAVRDNLNLQNTITCVGDRWLISELSPEAPVLVGCEPSGHVIVPITLWNDHKDEPDKILYTGNGLATVLKALSFLLNTSNEGQTEEQLFFVPGFRSRFSIRNCDMDDFYRNSKLWKKVDNIVRQIIQLKCSGKLFINEPDMLYLDLLESGGKSIGRWYMRKSGTEPKISFNLSLLQSYSDQGSSWMKALVQKISVQFG